MTRQEFLTELSKRYGYHIDKNNKAAISKIFDYVNSDPKKGICLAGPVGTGKTFFMRLLKRYIKKYHPKQLFETTTARDIMLDFYVNGFACLESYSKGNLFIDDVLNRNSVMHYGNAVDPVEMILYDRYENFIARKDFTHITTNLVPEKMSETFGQRIASRFKEMFEVFALGGEDRRK
jgi:DNA replication protein DnaC